MNILWGNIFRSGNINGKVTNDVCAVLAKVPVFEELSSRELHQIERILHRREYRQDEVIFLQGDPGLGMFIIEEGDVAIVLEPERHTLAELHEGEFFGELGLLDETPHTATAISLTQSKMLCFFYPDLLGLLDRNPRLGVKVLFRLARTIGKRLKKTNEYLRDMNRGKITEDNNERK